MQYFKVHRSAAAQTPPYRYDFLNTMWINFMHVEWTPAVTTGNRQIIISLYDCAGVLLYDLHPRVTQTLADGNIHYECYPGTNETSKASSHVNVNLPPTLVGVGCYVIITDENAVDLTNDTVEFSLQGYFT